MATNSRGDVISWNKSDVKSWLEDNDLQHLETWYGIESVLDFRQFYQYYVALGYYSDGCLFVIA